MAKLKEKNTVSKDKTCEDIKTVTDKMVTMKKTTKKTRKQVISFDENVNTLDKMVKTTTDTKHKKNLLKKKNTNNSNNSIKVMTKTQDNKSDVNIDMSQCTVRRSKRIRKVTDRYTTEVVIKRRRQKTVEIEKTDIRSTLKIISDENTSCNEDLKSKAKTATKTISKQKSSKSKEKKTNRRRPSIGGNSINKMLSNLRESRRKIPEHQKLKFVEKDPCIEILHQRIGLVTTRLSAIPESCEEYLYK
ncbi:uncharacterized protein LOC128952257 [Oppia nitens]|uniref:uncharacterized protein LOC128952257 n=1 Tax=Oppia nitens TaxID=1686743 RepID=UPI0023DBDC35|nr:uncharacterized protein LOC128952257 [Oppia nitens]